MNIISQILENENNKSFSINKFFKENNISGIIVYGKLKVPKVASKNTQYCR